MFERFKPYFTRTKNGSADRFIVAADLNEYGTTWRALAGAHETTNALGHSAHNRGADMRYKLDTHGIEFEISKPAAAKTTPNGVQKVDPATGWPVWAFQLTTWTNENDGSDVLVVNVAAPTAPSLRWREPV